MKNSTVVALATPPGTGGLAAIRLSGPDAFEIATRVFEGPGFSVQPAPRLAVYGILRHPGGDATGCSVEEYAIDKVVALPFKGPHSYTGEDTVEFFCHGGQVVTRAAIAACRAAGAEPAAAGEFTRRAFLNGKLSLDQAEAVADLIHAQSEYAARAAVRQLLGGLDLQLRTIEDPLLDLLTRLEGSLEFAEEEEISVPREAVVRVLAESVARLERLLAMAPAGRLLRDGIHVVLVGLPNVGKSSLFNVLLAEERALVDDEAGTTRDVVSGRVSRGGSVIVLHDTAGLRPEPGRVEQMGIERARRQLAEADLVLSLCETNGAEADFEVGAQAPVIKVWTKSDLLPTPVCADGVVVVSAATGEGVDDLWRTIDEAVVGFALEEAMALGVVLNERHLHRLNLCREELSNLHHEVESGPIGDEIVGSMLSSILSGLGEISGRVFTEHLLANIFQRFCVGK